MDGFNLVMVDFLTFSEFYDADPPSVIVEGWFNGTGGRELFWYRQVEHAKVGQGVTAVRY